ncbi:hypothetical protein IV203_015076 [Nitzschia inconspicua]|uniref:Uncharacterized protein n=1 Tax=Nitzschia inconspicua TaxID=303405 RepID=A0A9K3LAI1_9STRA|nr:hypothetical protein IV203_015076 [Nitzschia inconspicua]
MASIIASCFAPALPPDITMSSQISADMTVEDRLKAALRDQVHLQEALRMKQSMEDDLQREISFYKVKNQELNYILNALQSKNNGDQQQVMRAKAEQNAELTMQVRALKNLLNKSTQTVDSLKKDLQKIKEEKEALTKEQQSHERAISQINGLYNTVDKMQVSSMKTMQSEWLHTRWRTVAPTEQMDPHRTVQCISHKIIAIESDRQRLICKAASYQEDHVKQEERILELERQVKKLQEEKKEMRDERQSLLRELDLRAGKIGALEELFQTINSTRTLDIPENVEYESNEEKRETVSVMEEDAPIEGEGESEMKVVEVEESDDIISQTASNVGAAFARIMGTFSIDMLSLSGSQLPDAFAKDAPSFHTKDVEQELHEAAMIEVEEWKGKYQSLKHEHSHAQLKIANLTVQVQNLEQETANAKNKADLREGLLKDVIQQYKELEQEQVGANAQIARLKEKVALLVLKQYKQDKQEKTTVSFGVKKGSKDGDYDDFLASRLPTFETETSGITMEDDLLRPQDDSSFSAPSAGDDDEDKILLEDYKNLESECDRLHHEFEKAIAKISTMEKELEIAYTQAQASQKRHADQAHALALLEREKSQLQEELLEEKQKISEWKSCHEDQQADDLRMAELRAEQARSKQRERERDLWEVIEQYKELSKLNAEQQAHMNNVERELELTQRVQIQRRDLVYEYRKLERALEEAMDTVTQLEENLKQAKSEAARNKEESKSIRKLLAGCHFHYKQLQEKYNTILKQKDDLARQLQKAQKYDALRQEQAAFLKSQMGDLRENKRVSEQQIDRLTKENQELLKYCEDLLQLAKAENIAV